MVATRAQAVGSKFSSDDWCTPKWLADALGKFYADPCSNDRSHIKAELTLCGEGDHDDGLTCPWGASSVYCNPPYSNVMPWAVKLAAHAGPWCALLKLDPSTRWWATLMSAQPEIAPFRKRIKFEGDLAMTANFPSVLVYKRWAPPVEVEPHLWLRRWV